ncbi:unnamed protein product [marine sediment metagenome]|uniref:ABC transmembrane type-1 domain-containing protein n=1 Tax=marine sediment metagenome TaxID=412755 RepID=X1QIZ0_9ZZZZ
MFKDALKATIIYSFLGSILSIALGLAASLLLNRKFKGRGLVRAIFLFSYVAPVVSVAFIWKWLLNPVNGVISWALMSSGIWSEPVAMLSQRGWAMFIVILFQGWRYFPFAMLMILARLQAIPNELYEAADIDGANIIKKFFYITIPELKYVLGTLFLLRLMWTFNKFDDIYLLTSGAAGTKVLPVLTYEFSFGMLNFGLGSATSMFLFIISAGKKKFFAFIVSLYPDLKSFIYPDISITTSLGVSTSFIPILSTLLSPTFFLEKSL